MCTCVTFGCIRQLYNTTLIHYFHSKQEAEFYIIFVFGFVTYRPI
jgi:hypothetical protein